MLISYIYFYFSAYLGWSKWGDWDPCSKTCGGPGVQKRMRVCVGLLPINSTTCDSVCPGSNIETRACNTHDCPGLRIEDLYEGS